MAGISPPALTVETRDALHRGRRLEVFTVGWNLVEALVSGFAGVAAGSPSLVAFGIDAAIESVSGVTLLWRLQDREDHLARETFALRLVGASFLILAAYVLFDSVDALWRRTPPQASWLGVTIAGLSLAVMPWLAHLKREVAGQLDSRALEADARQTDLCAYLSAILLAGLLLNALLGWWWSDPVAGLLMMPIIGREGVTALRGDRCEC